MEWSTALRATLEALGLALLVRLAHSRQLPAAVRVTIAKVANSLPRLVLLLVSHVPCSLSVLWDRSWKGAGSIQEEAARLARGVGRALSNLKTVIQLRAFVIPADANLVPQVQPVRLVFF